MEFFKRAKAIRLKSQHNKYMVAQDDEESVKQRRNGSSKAARWTVEPVDGKPDVIRLKSCESSKYLSASDDPFLFGMTGKKVVQASPRLRLDPVVEWEPIKEGSYIKLRTRRGNFLRANGGVPPWMNSITHDVPSRSATKDWILWIVDVVEVDYQVQPTVSSVESNVVPDPGRVPSRYSSFSSMVSVSDSKLSEDDDFKDYHEVGSPGSASQIPPTNPSTKSAPKVDSTKLSGVSPDHLNHVHHESQHSNSFTKLNSMLEGLQDLLENTEQDQDTSNFDTDHSSTDSISHDPHPFEVKMAKQTLIELNNLDFSNILSTGRDKKLDKAVAILIADAKGQLHPCDDLVHLQDKLKSLRGDHESASQDLTDFTAFAAKKIDVKAELKKDAAKAHELQTMEVGFNNMLANARAKREVLLKQLEEIENSIKAAERAQVDNGDEIEELILRIGESSESLREMEGKEKSWQERRVEAELTFERVEDEWTKVKSMLQDV